MIRLPSYRSRHILSNRLLSSDDFHPGVEPFAPTFRQALDFYGALKQFQIWRGRNVEMIELGDRQAWSFTREKMKLVACSDFALLDNRKVKPAVAAVEELSNNLIALKLCGQLEAGQTGS